VARNLGSQIILLRLISVEHMLAPQDKYFGHVVREYYCILLFHLGLIQVAVATLSSVLQFVEIHSGRD